MSLALPPALALQLPDGTIKRILLEDYLRGVVAAALPADAPLEAMKALAVAARTFAATTHRHAEHHADVCTTRHCQAWSERANPRAARAVLETRGMVAMFDDKLIEAFYFEHCDGKTREAKGVLMDAPPYLKSVACPCGFASMKGHGIGMCQRGMLAMARFGERYDLILKHYYSGIALQALGTAETTGESQRASQSPAPAAKHLPTSIKREAPELKRDVAGVMPEKPARKTIAPRRAARPKIEQPPETPSAPPETPPVAAPEPSVTLPDAHSPEEDDLFMFLAVEDVKPPEEPKPPPLPKPPTVESRPPTPFAPPPLHPGGISRRA